MRILEPTPLTRSAFRVFGEVIELEGARQIPINQGLTTRFHDLFTLDCCAEGGHPSVNVFRTDSLPLPHTVEKMERHPFGSQAFWPLDRRPFLILVAPPGDSVSSDDLILFRTSGYQGVNFFRNTWHHFQIVTGNRRDFIVVDRAGPGKNLEERPVQGAVIIVDDALKNRELSHPVLNPK